MGNHNNTTKVNNYAYAIAYSAEQEREKNMNNCFSFKVAALRTIKSPVRGMDITRYMTWVNLRDMPEGLPTEVNPRETKMTTATAKKLLASVASSDPNFDVYNRGMVVVADNVRFDNTQSVLTVDFDSDNSKFGVLDGGHTYKAIISKRQDIPEDVDKFVMMEILVGSDLDSAAISDARNTSVQVSDIALFNLENSFDIVKEAIANESYKDRVAYKDNQEQNNKDIDIHISDLLKLMFAFNIKKFPDAGSSFPISAYSGKAMVFKDYKTEYGKEEDNIYKELVKQLPTLVKLYEQIQIDMPEFYRESKNNKARFGGIRGIEGRGNYKTDFTRQAMDYQISAGYIMPIFGAFRALLRNRAPEGEPYQLAWRFDPLEYWQLHGASLVEALFDFGTNPNASGKDPKVWRATYSALQTKMQAAMIRELENRQI